MSFDFSGSNNNQPIEKYINSAKVFVYNSKKELVRTQPVSQEELKNPRGIELDIPLGEEYTAVCWANVGSNTSIQGSENLTSSKVQTVGGITSDNLYYGVSSFHFGSNSQAEQRLVRMDFKSAHIKMNISVKGFAEAFPRIRIEGLQAIYDLQGNGVSEFSHFFMPEVAYDNTEKAYSARLSILKPQSIDKTIIKVSHAGNDPIAINLKQFLSNYYPNINLSSGKEVVIDLVVEYNGVNVTVTIPNWNSNDTSTNVG